MDLYADSPEAPLRPRNAAGDAEPSSPKQLSPKHELYSVDAAPAPGEDADAAFARLCAEQERVRFVRAAA